MNKKIISVIFAALMGAGVGAFLSYGPLQKFKAEAVLNFEMSAPDYKRFVQALDDRANLKRYAERNAPAQHMGVESIPKAAWYQPVSKIGKTDFKDLPDVVKWYEIENAVKCDSVVENDSEKPLEKDSKLKRKEFCPYAGLQVSSVASNPQSALDIATWLSQYAADTAIFDATQNLLSKWTKENKLLADSIPLQKVQLNVETEQSKLKLDNIKKITTTYTDTVQKEAKNIVNSQNLGLNGLSAKAQQLSTELDLLGLDVKNQNLSRAIEQQTILDTVIMQVKTLSLDSKNGLERLAAVDGLLVSTLNKAETLAAREKLLLMSAEVSTIKSRIIKKPVYVTPPSMPVRPDGPTPIKLSMLMGILFASLTAIYCWQKTIQKLFIQNENSLAIQKQ
jgi:hypothetical protein